MVAKLASEQPDGPPSRSPRRARLLLAAMAATVLGTLAVASPAPAAKVVYGVVPQDGALPEASDLDRMRPAGITGLRTMLSWASVESTEGRYDWGIPDAIIRETTRRGIQPLVFLYGTPAWAAHRDGRDCTPAECSVYPPKSAATLAAFERFAAAAAARYGPGGQFWTGSSGRTDEISGNVPTLQLGVIDCLLFPDDPACQPPTPPPVPPPPPPSNPPGPGEPPCGCTKPSPIRAWQIWNEQNSPKYFAPEVDVPAYVALLKSAAAGIRSADPGADIVLGGMWGPNSARRVVMPTNKYLKQLYRAGAKEHFDSIAIHPYANGAKESVAQLRSARKVVKRAGDRRAGMWVTEVGWAGKGPKSNPYVKGLRGQARTLSRALSDYHSLRRSLRLRGVFWYSWRDKKGGDAICEWCGHAGLRTKKGKAKPAWRAFRQIARR